MPTNDEAPEHGELTDNESDEEAPEPTILDYLATERGHEFGMRVLTFCGEFRAATIDAAAKQRADEMELRRLTLEDRNRSGKRTWWLQTLGLLVVVGSVAGLSAFDRLTPAAGTILGAVAGYLFGQRRPNEPPA